MLVDRAIDVKYNDVEFWNIEMLKSTTLNIIVTSQRFRWFRYHTQIIPHSKEMVWTKKSMSNAFESRHNIISGIRSLFVLYPSSNIHSIKKYACHLMMKFPKVDESHMLTIGRVKLDLNWHWLWFLRRYSSWQERTREMYENWSKA